MGTVGEVEEVDVEEGEEEMVGMEGIREGWKSLYVLMDGPPT